MLAVTLVILVWTLFPVYYMVLLSLTPTNDLFQPALYIDNPTLRSYIYTRARTTRSSDISGSSSRRA